MLVPSINCSKSVIGLSQKQIPTIRYKKIENFFPEGKIRSITKIPSHRCTQTPLKQRILHHYLTSQTSNLTLNSTNYQTTSLTLERIKSQNKSLSLKSSSIPKKNLTIDIINDVMKHYNKLKSKNLKINVDKKLLEKKRQLKLKISQMVSNEKDNFCSTFERKNYLNNLKILDYLGGERRVKKAIQYHQQFRFGNDFEGESHNVANFISETQSLQNPKNAQKKIDEKLTIEEKRLLFDDPLFFVRNVHSNSKLFTAITLSHRLQMEEKNKIKQTEPRTNTINNHERNYVRKITRRLTRAEIKDNNFVTKKKRKQKEVPDKQNEINSINNKIKKILYDKRTIDLNSKSNNSLLHIEQTMKDLNQQILKRTNKIIENKFDLNDVFLKRSKRSSTKSNFSRNKKIKSSSNMNYLYTYNVLTPKESKFVNYYSQTIKDSLLCKDKESGAKGGNRDNSIPIRTKFRKRTRLLSHYDIMSVNKTIKSIDVK